MKQNALSSPPKEWVKGIGKGKGRGCR